VHVTASQLKAQVDGADPFVVDVREPAEYDAGHVPGSVLMPLATVPVRHHELPRDETIYLVCQTGGRSFTAATWLSQQGYDVRNVSGGVVDWVGQGYPVTRGRTP
jgi:rhodanese-related sulfurtransferase